MKITDVCFSCILKFICVVNALVYLIIKILRLRTKYNVADKMQNTWVNFEVFCLTYISSTSKPKLLHFFIALFFIFLGH